MTIRNTITWSAVSLLAVAVGAGTADAQQATTKTHRVQGHGIYSQDVGADDGGQFIDQVSINAWLDDAGVAHGSVLWAGVYHSVPADPDSPGGPGPGVSGYTWYLEVVDLAVIENTATILAVVALSPQVPSAEGYLVEFEVFDVGTGANDLPDGLGIWGEIRPIDGGDFTVE